MKKITLSFIAAMCFAVLANAQTEQGRLMVGGSVGFTSMSNKIKSGGVSSNNGSISTIVVNPSAGYFVADGIAVGAGLAFISATNKPEIGNKTTSSSFTFAPFGRYYVNSRFFGTAGIQIGTRKAELGGGSERKDNIFGWLLGAGYAIFLNDNVAVEPLVTYSSTSYKNKDSDFKSTDSGLMINVGFNIFIN